MEAAMASAVHISLNVSDFSRSTDFYRRFFGQPAKLKADYAKFVAKEPEIHLALQPGAVSGGAGALSHLGIRVDSTDRVQEWKKALNGRGLSTHDEAREACCYALQDKFWVTDPDGNRWEVYTVLEDLDRNTEPAAKSCCAPAKETGGACCAG
jgi:catechol 2,3-dioxygenase-like lactoylglutathione lyase family enzyme